MNILFVSIGKIDINTWSGTTIHIYKCINRENIKIDKCEITESVLWKNIVRVYNKLHKKNKLIPRNKSILTSYSKQIKKKLDSKKYDLIVSIGSLPITLLDTNIPIIVITDGTFNIIKNYYNAYSELTEKAIKSCENYERIALAKASKVILASKWAQNSVINHYNISKEKTMVCPFGANFESNFCNHELDRIIEKKSINKIELLFVGKEWNRKGGDKILDIIYSMKKKGVDVTLHIVGCEPKIPEDLLSNIVIHGFIDKGSDEGVKKLRYLYEKCHLFIMLSIAECYGIVFCEASSFGLPSIAHNTGGISTAVKNGVNGQCFDITSKPEDIASYIIEIMKNKDEYYKLCKSTYNYFKENLNWNSAGNIIVEEINKIYELRGEL